MPGKNYPLKKWSHCFGLPLNWLKKLADLWLCNSINQIIIYAHAITIFLIFKCSNVNFFFERFKMKLKRKHCRWPSICHRNLGCQMVQMEPKCSPHWAIGNEKLLVHKISSFAQPHWKSTSIVRNSNGFFARADTVVSLSLSLALFSFLLTLLIPIGMSWEVLYVMVSLN